ncbi:MAG: hypothetical protein ACK4WH_13060 [Phycisphaerales bacterium]
MTERELEHIGEDSASCGPVSHDEAYDHLLRFTHKAFGRSGSMPILSIPADVKRDSDLRLGAYIFQCREREKMLREVAAELGVSDSIDIATCNVLLHQIQALKANQKFSDVQPSTLSRKRLDECKKICACVPFIDNGHGVSETMDAMRELIQHAEHTGVTK